MLGLHKWTHIEQVIEHLAMVGCSVWREGSKSGLARAIASSRSHSRLSPSRSTHGEVGVLSSSSAFSTLYERAHSVRMQNISASFPSILAPITHGWSLSTVTTTAPASAYGAILALHADARMRGRCGPHRLVVSPGMSWMHEGLSGRNSPSCGPAAAASGTPKTFSDPRELFDYLVHVNLPPLLRCTHQLVVRLNGYGIYTLMPSKQCSTPKQVAAYVLLIRFDEVRHGKSTGSWNHKK